MDFENVLADILAGPKFPDHEFIIGQYTYADVYSMAGSICRDLPQNCGNVCLLTEDKGITAAAVLASIGYGFTLVLPYACSKQAVNDISEIIELQAVISDMPVYDLKNISNIVPLPNKDADISLISQKAPPKRSDETCFYFFTGGSTGRPKMWAKTPRNLLGEALFQVLEHKITSKDCILATIPPYHIYGILYSVLVPFIIGARVVKDICTYPEEIRQAFIDYSPSIFVSVPVHYRILNGTEIGGESLRLAFSSAGRLDEADGEYFTRAAGAPVVEIYGSTETGGIAARTRAKGETWLTPFDVVEWKIIGERLCVKSEFISPGIETENDGFFITGDRVKSDDGKHFILLGRADGIIKVGGKRVDLEDAQEKLKQIEGVEDIVLISVAGNNVRENEVCALVQADKLDKNIFKAKAVKLVQPYAVPRRVEVVDKIPVSDTGKYDRKAVESFFKHKYFFKSNQNSQYQKI